MSEQIFNLLLISLGCFGLGASLNELMHRIAARRRLRRTSGFPVKTGLGVKSSSTIEGDHE